MSEEGLCRICGRRLPRGQRPARCRGCGFTWLGDDALVFDYEEAYDETALYNSLPPPRILEHYRRAPNTAWALSHLARLRRLERAGALVEFGSSQGAFLVLAGELGFSVHGIELSGSSVEYGRGRLGLGARLEHGPWRFRRADESPVEVVCAFEVLEHSRDPLELLRMAISWLAPGGRLLLSVPNDRRLAVRLGRREPQDRPPHHLMYWTRRSLCLAVESLGLQVVETRTSPLTHSALLGVAAPGLSRRRAADVGSLRPVGSEPAASGLPGWLVAVYPAFVAAGKVAARGLDLVPELGARLMLMARLPAPAGGPVGRS